MEATKREKELKREEKEGRKNRIDAGAKRSLHHNSDVSFGQQSKKGTWSIEQARRVWEVHSMRRIISSTKKSWLESSETSLAFSWLGSSHAISLSGKIVIEVS